VDAPAATDRALFALLQALRTEGYAFVAPTPAPHARVVGRPGKGEAADLRDIFGWSLPFRAETLAPHIRQIAERAAILLADGDLWRSALRVSSLGETLLLHSAFPTDARDAVFFGPDSYRFADFLRAELPRTAATRRLVDLGTGTGAGAIAAAPLLPGARLTLTDVNPAALRLAAINARHAGVTVELVSGAGLGCVAGPMDLVIANPPYIAGSGGRSYRDGGDLHGGRVSLDWALDAARRLEPGGRMLLYTGSAIVAGRDPLRLTLAERLPALGCSLRYREIDPDVFGEELGRPEYADVDRIAAVGAVIEKG
jgi:hypothetical protein